MNATTTKPPDQARSKILRLAFADRMQFNRLARDNYTGSALIAWLAAHGVPDVNPENLRKYKLSREYRAWLDEEANVQADCDRAEKAMRLAEALGGSASEKLKSILAGKLYGLLDEIGDPEKAQSLVAAVRAVTDAERLDLQRQQLAQRDQALAMQREKMEVQSCELFLKWMQDKRALAIADGKTSNAEKIAALRREFFKDVDALEKSGQVELPQ